MIKLLLAAAILALPQAAAAQSCLTREEVSKLIVFSAPTVIEAAAKKCAPVLGSNAYLRTGAPRLAGRLRSEGRAASAGIVPIFAKIGGDKIPAGLSPETLQGVIRDVFSAQLTKDIATKDCAGIDFIVAAIDPVPAASFGDLVAGMMALTGSPDSKAPFRVCADAAP